MSYRFATLGCTHTGYSARGMRMHRDTRWNLRVVDGQIAYQEAITAIIDAGCRGVWHGGDVTHWSRPLPRDVETVQRLDDLLFDAGLWNGKNSGNHCAGAGSDLSAVSMFDRPTMNSFTVYPDPRRPAEDCVGPHPGLYEIHQPDPEQPIYLHVVSHYGLDPELREQGIDIDPRPLDHGVNILCSHGIFVGDERLYKAAERHGAERLIPTDWVTRGFDLTLLSDYHTPGRVEGFGTADGYGQVWYTGSTVRRGFSDDETPRGWLQVDIPDQGAPQVQLQEIWQRPQLDFEPINASGTTVADLNDLVRSRLAERSWHDPRSAELTGDGGWILRQRIVGASPQQRQGIYELSGEWAQAAADAAYWSFTFENPISAVSLAHPATVQASINERVTDFRIALDERADRGNVAKALRDAPEELREAALARARAVLGAPRQDA
ncbi:hypothetical protein [Rhodococcus sp. NPDC060176]|uniref:hypothetical protein n=1 Tax=Rhodococcus sp. NPDC060176 TaxID=3347062 RepID=UPI00364EB326